MLSLLLDSKSCPRNVSGSGVSAYQLYRKIGSFPAYTCALYSGQLVLYWTSAFTPSAAQDLTIASCSATASAFFRADQIWMTGRPLPPGYPAAVRSSAAFLGS